MSSVFSRMFCVLALIFCACSTQLKPYAAGVLRTRPINISVDDKFTFTQQKQIHQVFVAWTKASGNRVRFIVHWNQRKPGAYSSYEKPTAKDGIFMWSLDKEKDITTEFAKESEIYLGLMVYGEDERSGNVIIFTNANGQMFYPVVLHEIGHLIGLWHTPGVVSAMRPEISTIGCISQLDAQNLCAVYGCDPHPQCIVSEQKTVIAKR